MSEKLQRHIRGIKCLDARTLTISDLLTTLRRRETYPAGGSLASKGLGISRIDSDGLGVKENECLGEAGVVRVSENEEKRAVDRR